jgi:hypothetical protein
LRHQPPIVFRVSALRSIADGRVAVPAHGENRARPPAPFSETNNECQIKFELLQLSPASLATRANGRAWSDFFQGPPLG